MDKLAMQPLKLAAKLITCYTLLTLLTIQAHGVYSNRGIKPRSLTPTLQAKQLLKQGDVKDALPLVIQIHNEEPENLEARKMLAEINRHAFKRPDVAVQILEEGLEFGSTDAAYCRSFFGTAYRFGYLQKIILHGRPIYETSKDTELRDVAALALAQAYLKTGEPEKGLEILDAHDVEPFHKSSVLNYRLMAASGDRFRASLFLNTVNLTLPDNWRAQAALVDFHRDAGNYVKAQHYVEQLIEERPDYCHWRIMEIDVASKLHEESQVTEATEDYLIRFREDEDALFFLGLYAANEGNVELTDLVYTASIQENYLLINPTIYRIEARLNASQFEQALEILNSRREILSRYEQDEAFAASLRMIALYGMGKEESASVQLHNAKESTILTPAMKRRLSKILRVINYEAEATALELSAENE